LNYAVAEVLCKTRVRLMQNSDYRDPMTESDIRHAIFKVFRKIAPEANLDELGPSENLREALDIDSFDFLNLMIGLHDELHVEIQEADYPKLTTLGELVSYLSDRLK
jgi:acyl carrier protein